MGWDNYNPNPEYPELRYCSRCDEHSPILVTLIKQKEIERTKLGNGLRDYVVGEMEQEYICIDCLSKDINLAILSRKEERNDRFNRSY